ncbi:DUF3054 family protein [Gordonia pseudamarae]|jgi:hypothetical protein|uniref:DUF3054 family protein n=1 Tax=Gordonia pseudamarae TaxID=2831662 RepID=A0ABX6ICZ0_9ACTN|nr:MULTISPECIES: DUF3054 domain-containing protein [Gordonia]MBD0021983.1 DUF3054 domain-containing protein [Gordonia sp. (in: high G+C Gram-positive bacteria)]QHN24850.1 DUF3054 family protein [Gordonia pseudamarae]QHN33783.1 DUF3054 family protein [Gordonia pseudamarae]
MSAASGPGTFSGAEPDRHPREGRRYTVPVWATALLDLVAVVVFVIIGRADHEHGLSPAGILDTLWPFAVGTAVGWTLVYLYTSVESAGSDERLFHPERLPQAITIWVCTVAIGMLLRWLFHQGVAVSFVIVASIALGLFLLGWRAVAALIGRRTA